MILMRKKRMILANKRINDYRQLSILGAFDINNDKECVIFIDGKEYNF